MLSKWWYFWRWELSRLSSSLYLMNTILFVSPSVMITDGDRRNIFQRCEQSRLWRIWSRKFKRKVIERVRELFMIFWWRNMCSKITNSLTRALYTDVIGWFFQKKSAAMTNWDFRRYAIWLWSRTLDQFVRFITEACQQNHRMARPFPRPNVPSVTHGNAKKSETTSCVKKIFKSWCDRDQSDDTTLFKRLRSVGNADISLIVEWRLYK